MSDEEGPKYKDGDIVWVKLGPCWWPGEVTENGPEDFTSKKAPIAIVKFFNENTYEFVKSYNHIYAYNCERKNEFIKKGMDSFRANNTHMSKFPGDVSLAEIRTDGNPNILTDPIFAPQKKTNIIAEVFGSPSPKKTPKDKQSRGRSKNSNKKPKVNITHRRFLGCDDYEAHIRVQYPGKDTEHMSSDEDEIVRLNAEPNENFNCSSCSFTTNRLEVMLFHVQCHIKGIATPVKIKKKGAPKKKKSRIIKHITSDDDITNSSAGFLDTDSEEEVKPKPKRKKRTTGARKPKQKKMEEEKTATDIRTNLLAEWSDSDENETETSKHDTSEEIKETTEGEVKTEKQKKKDKDVNKSCFDFDEEEEEEDNSIVHTAVGRKIPRVIPPTDKRKSSDPDTEDASLPTAEDDANRMGVLKVNDNINESSNSLSTDASKEEEVFKDLMESTSVPELPDVPDATKSQKIITDSKSAKIPDKKTETEVATKLTNPKKRFVKSFEDFELLQNEQRRAQEEKEESKKEKAVVVEPVDALEPTPVVQPSAVVQPSPTIEPSSEEQSLSEEPRPSSSEEEREKPIEEASEKNEEKPIQEVSEPKTESGESSPKKLDGNLQISKLKCQLMSKLSDEEHESLKASKGKSHRSPRSKILESYRNDKSKEKPKKETDDEDDSKKDRHSPKKSKFLKFNQEEESSDKIEEEPTREEATKSDIIKEVEAIPEKNPDEEIGKINQIDEYLNDFFFDFPKKSESPKVEEEAKAENKPEEKPSNELTIKCASNDSEEGGSVDIAIKTNLTNFNKNEQEMSALSTLAIVSELETSSAEKTEQKKEEVVKLPFEKKTESELVAIDGNLTVVSEKDLQDKQVEITTGTSPTNKKPVTLTNFSMDFSECNSDSQTSEPKDEEVKKADDLFDIEDHIPSQIVDKAKPIQEATTASSSKLLERLTEPKPKDITPKSVKVPVTKDSTKLIKTKFVLKPSASNKIIKTPQQSNKPIILSEKIIKPVTGAGNNSGSVSVQKITSKRNLQDPDEIDTFIIQKEAKNVEESEELDEVPAKKIKKIGIETKKVPVSSNSAALKKRGKAKILQQTIITPAGEIIQPNTSTATAVVMQDDNVFDINSMPIVLSDQILTPESIENMPIYLSDSVQTTTEPVTPTTKIQTIVKKTPVTVPNQQMRVINKTIASPKVVKTTPKIIGSVGSKIIKQNSFPSASSKHGKYVIVTQASGTSTPSKYAVAKKQTIIKRVSGDVLSTTGTLTKVQNLTPEPSGNKIMILTDQQGQQQRVLLTPAQQKMIGYQGQGAKITKTVVKGNIIQKGKDGQIAAVPGSSGLISKTVTPSRLNSNQTIISSSGHVLTQVPQQSKTIRMEKSSTIQGGRKIQMQSQKVQIKPPQQKTILIKNQHGQTVRKIQGTDDALLDKQVAEQIEAIKASGILQQKQEILNYKTTPKAAVRRSYAKKVESPKTVVQKPKETVVPPLAPISPKKPEVEKTTQEKQERALHHLVIQDAMGNQTTITEGQILALPSETVDGQPQSYMLVTLDESGNLTPLNNEALLSLDPNLGLGGDLSNTVLQIDQNALKEETVTQQEVEAPKPEPIVTEPQKEEVKPPEVEVPPEPIADQAVMPMNEAGQQLIVTGDPIAAQKFLESLTEGNTDLANILASAEGSILIHADGQQILINTDSDNQMLLSVNTDNLNMTESTEGGGNPIFATQPTKNQDILAAALADTDVFQQEQNGSQGKVSQLSPNSALYPMNVGNVLETSLTLNSPIMTPLEVPSTNSKKISDENDILNQVPKNVDLPITITDPNISQTVSQQQAASLMVNELQTNLDLALPISDAAITVTSTDMNSPSFVYSLPTLDGADISQKPFNSSMPLLTEDSEETSNETKDDKAEKPKTPEEDKPKISTDGSFLDESEGLCTLGGEMCSSLSEPPPDMFDLSAVLSSHQIKSDSESSKETPKGDLVMEESELKIDDKGGEESSEVTTETSSPNTMNEDSCEIPVQPEIVTTLKEEEATKRAAESEIEVDNKKCKFD